MISPAAISRLVGLSKRRWRLGIILRNRRISHAERLAMIWELFRRAWLGPSRLSAHVVSVWLIAARANRGEVVRFGERFHRLVHSCYTIRASALLGGAIFVSVAGFAIAYGLGHETANGASKAEPLLGTLATIAEVLGGVAGLLFAAIVFGLQFHGERLGQASFLVRYLGRREGVVPIAAITLAVVGANAVVALAGSLGVPAAVFPMAAADLILVPGVLVLSLWLLYRMVVSVSGDFFEESLIPGLSWEFRRGLDEDSHHARVMDKYLKVLDRAGLKHTVIPELFEIDETARHKFRLPRRGRVADVDLSAIIELGALITCECPGAVGGVSVGPDEVVEGQTAFYVEAERDEDRRRVGELGPLKEETARKIRRLLMRAFSVRRVHGRDVIGVLNRFAKALVDQARQDKPAQLHQALKVQERLIELRLKRAGSRQPQESFHRKALPDYLGSFVYFDVARAAVTSEDREKVETLLRFAGRVMGLAIEYRHPSLLTHAGQIMGVVYYASSEHSALADYVGESIDSWIYAVLGQFKSRRTPEKHEASIQGERDVLLAAVAWLLRLVRLALDSGRTRDAGHFHSRTFDWDSHRDLRDARRYRYKPVSPERGWVLDLHSFAEIVVIGWCLRIAKNSEKTDAAERVLAQSSAELTNRQEVLRVFEWASEFDSHPNSLADRLGVSVWARESKHLRAGHCEIGPGPDEGWITDGLVAALLICPDAARYEAPQIMSQSPAQRPMDVAGIRRRATSLLNGDGNAPAILQVADNEKGERIEAVCSLIAGRHRLYKITQLQRVLDIQVQESRSQQLKEEIATLLLSKRYFARLLEQLGATEKPAQAWLRWRIGGNASLSKEVASPDYGGDRGICDYFAGDLGACESATISWVTEQILDPFAKVDDLKDLSAAVKAAADELQSRGFYGTVILLPRQRRFARALTDLADWKVPGFRKLGGQHLGEWEGLQLVKCAHWNCQSVVLLDPSEFYGLALKEPAGTLEFSIEDRFAKENRLLVEEAEKIDDCEKIPDTSRLCVVGTGRFISGIGIGDPRAAIRIDLDLTRLGYATRAGDAFYHRPDCPSVKGNGEVIYTLDISPRSDRQVKTPCPECAPKKWSPYSIAED